MKQLSKEVDNDSVNLEAVDLSLANLKEVSASWLVEAADHVSENPLFIIHGFCCSGITAAIDKAIGHESDNSKEVEEMEDSYNHEEQSCSDDDENDELEEEWLRMFTFTP